MHKELTTRLTIDSLIVIIDNSQVIRPIVDSLIARIDNRILSSICRRKLTMYLSKLGLKNMGKMLYSK